MLSDGTISRALARKKELTDQAEALEAQKEALEREIERRHSEIREIETFVSVYPRFAEGPEETPLEAGDGSELPEEQVLPDATTSGTVMVTQDQFEADIRKLLIDNGRPMKRGQLINGLHSRGLRVGGSNELKNFGAKIWKARDRFVNIAHEGYWPIDIPCPAVRYKPQQSAGTPTS